MTVAKHEDIEPTRRGPYEVQPEPQPQPSSPAYYEVSLRDVVRTLLRGSWIIALVMAVGLALGVWWLKNAPHIYTAQMVVAPANSDSGQVASGRLAQLAGLAGRIAGVSTAPDSVSKFDRFLQLATSVTLAERLDEKYGLVRVIAANSWDEQAGRYVPPKPGLLARLNRFFGLPTWTKPDARTLADFISSAIKIKPFEETGMRIVTFSDPNPVFAAQMLERIRSEADEILRQQDMMRTLEQIKYLKEQLQTVTFADHRLALTSLLSEQEKSMMLVNSNEAYAVEMVDPPSAPSVPSKPKPFQTLLIIAAVGLFAGILVVFLKEALKSEPRSKRKRPQEVQ